MIIVSTIRPTEIHLQKYGSVIAHMLDLIMSDLGPSLLYKLTGGSGDVEDVNLDAEYDLWLMPSCNPKNLIISPEIHIEKNFGPLGDGRPGGQSFFLSLPGNGVLDLWARFGQDV